MTRIELPVTPGDYTVDGVSVIVLPGKIIVDTGTRSHTRPTQPSNTKYKPAYVPKKKTGKQGNGSRKTGEQNPMFPGFGDYQDPFRSEKR